MSNRVERLKSEETLKSYIKDRCEENNVSVSFDEKIEEKNYVIVKVDDYYQDLHINKTPPAPDCLILLKCVNRGYSLTIVELKSIESSKHLEIENVFNKFEICLNDFIKNRFKRLLYIEYKDIKLLFVSNIEIYRRDAGLKMQRLISKRFSYKNKKLMITPYKPVPTIKQCY